MHLNPTTGQWEQDDDGPAPPQAGVVGDQAGAAIDIGAPTIITPEAAAAPGVDIPPPAAVPPIAPNAVPLPAVQIPQVAPAPMPEPPVPIPVGRVVSPAEADNMARLDANTVAREKTAAQGGETAVAKATTELKQADADAAEGDRYLKERGDISKAWADVRQNAEAQHQQDYERYREIGLHDPAADETFGHRLLAAISIGLGQYSAAMNGGKNTALEMIEGQTARSIQKQKDEVALAARKAEMSGQNVDKIREQANAEMQELTTKHAAILSNVKDKWGAELKRIGVPQAQIDSNKNLQKLDADSLELRQGVLQSVREDTTALERAEIAAAAHRRTAKGSAGGGGVKGAGAGGMDAIGELNGYLEKNPGDNEGAYKLAGSLGIKDPKLVAKAIADSKSSEGQGKHAAAAATMMRSISAIETLQKKYTPSQKDWLTWQKNQDDVKLASAGADKGEVGKALLGRAAQGIGALSKTEYEGLNGDAKAYFENVKRILESVGREQSGAAISRSEWDNFGGQYGLQAAGGLEAAREYARDRLKLSGTAGRQLEASGSVPKTGGAKPTMSSAEHAGALEWLRKNPSDPRAGAIRKKLGIE
jgi:hypothetical protein